MKLVLEDYSLSTAKSVKKTNRIHEISERKKLPGEVNGIAEKGPILHSEGKMDLPGEILGRLDNSLSITPVGGWGHRRGR